MNYINLQACFHASDAQKIAQADIATLSNTPLRLRFQIIAALRDIILERAETMGIATEEKIDESTAPDAFEALFKLASSIRHSNAYYQWARNTRNSFAAAVWQNDVFYSLQQWSTLYNDEREVALKQSARLLLKIASRDLPFRLMSPQFDLSIKKHSDHDFDYGCHYGEIGEPACKRWIEMNIHKDARFHDLRDALNTLFHEIHHDMGVQIAGIFSKNPKLLGSLLCDAALWKLMAFYNAEIPSSLYRPYRAQFHEALSLEEGREAERIVDEIFTFDWNPHQEVTDIRNRVIA